jgi:hypothetical protein
VFWCRTENGKENMGFENKKFINFWSFWKTGIFLGYVLATLWLDYGM